MLHRFAALIALLGNFLVGLWLLVILIEHAAGFDRTDWIALVGALNVIALNIAVIYRWSRFFR